MPSRLPPSVQRPCSQHIRQQGLEPFSEPTQWEHGQGTTLACAGYCDEDIAGCFCNSTFAHGRIPADPEAPPGTPPRRRGRPIPFFCQPGPNWSGTDAELIWGEKGWCQVGHTTTCDGPNCRLAFQRRMAEAAPSFCQRCMWHDAPLPFPWWPCRLTTPSSPASACWMAMAATPARMCTNPSAPTSATVGGS